MKKRKAQAVIFYCAENNVKHFLLLKMNERRNHYWQNITGFVEDHETFLEGAKREAIEETNLSPENIKNLIDIEMTFEFHDRWGNDVVEEVFAIETKAKWEVVLDPTEHQDFVWIEDSELTKDSVHFDSNYQALQRVKERL